MLALLLAPGDATAQAGHEVRTELARASLSPPSAGAPAKEPYASDAAGRRLRVGFDPGRRLDLGVGHAPVLRAGPLEVARWQLDGGLSWRHELDFDDEGIRWKLEHRFVDASVAFSEADRGLAGVGGELYALRFLRWADDGSITLPSTPPRRLSFPFGIGFALGVGRLEVERSGGEWSGEVGVARGALLLDLWPRREEGRFVTLGVGTRYDLRIAPPTVDPASDAPRLEHVVVPFSQPELTLRHESSDGHHAFETAARGGWAWASAGGSGMQAAARARYEVITMAVNDVPLRIGAEVRWRWDPALAPDGAAHQVAGIWGVRLGVPLD